METQTVEAVLNHIAVESDPTLSDPAKDLIIRWLVTNKHQPVDRPSWDELWLQLADDVSDRSIDAQSHVGAVIVNRNNHILAVGYNGFMCGIEDHYLPNVRPQKYPWMLHAELNAILNCEHKPRGAVLYCTCHPCLHCFQAIVQSGISEVVYNTIRKATMVDEEMQTQLEIAKWLARKKVTVREHYYKGKEHG